MIKFLDYVIGNFSKCQEFFHFYPMKTFSGSGGKNQIVQTSTETLFNYKYLFD